LIRCRFPLSDDAENPPWLVRLTIQSVAAILVARVPLLVCCSAGMSRSVCITAAGLALAEKMSIDDALKEVIGTGPADVSPGFYLKVLEMVGSKSGTALSDTTFGSK
jgi:protein-tyrosine phosphatase